MDKNVVIIGRPNVGKSTLFNRLIGSRKAIVHHIPGTTRDRNEHRVNWQGRAFILADTGGWAMNDEVFSESVKKQMETGLKKADLVLFLVDGKDGLHPLDKEIFGILRKTNKKYLLIVNKIDNEKDELKAYDFLNLGTNSVLSVSAQHGRNIDELLAKIISNLPIKSTGEKSFLKPEIRIILVGKPNVGKSSLLNRLSNEDRSIVHDKPGTTREAFDTVISKENHDFFVIDTPGLHRKRKFKDDMEYLSALSTQHAFDNADVALLVADAVQGIGETEARIAQLIVENGKGCLIVVNKWDIVEERETALKIIRQSIEDKLKFLKWAEILFVSAKTALRTDKIFKLVEEIFEEYSKICPQAELSDVIRGAEAEKPFARRGEKLHIRSIQQVSVRPPVFSLGVSKPELVHFTYKRFLENKIREKFKFSGTPVYLKFFEEKGHLKI